MYLKNVFNTTRNYVFAVLVAIIISINLFHFMSRLGYPTNTHVIFKSTKNALQPPSNLPLNKLPARCDDSPNYSFNRYGTPCINYSDDYTYAVRVADPNLTYVFCAAPRCSSALHRAIGLRVMKLGNWDGQPIQNKNWTSFRLKQEEFAPLFLNESVPRFIIVRNPMARAVSAFIRTFKYSHDVNDPKLPSYFEDWVLKTMRWDSSSNKKTLIPIPWMNYTYPQTHLRPQTMFCGFSVRDVWSYFTVIKVEDKKLVADYMYRFMPEEFHYGWGDHNESLRNLLMGDDTVKRSPQREGDLLSYLSFHRKHSDSSLHAYYRNEDVFDRVVAAYSEDIRALNYKADVQQLRRQLFNK